MKLIEITADRFKDDGSYWYKKGELLWLDDYTAHNLIIIGIAKLRNGIKNGETMRVNMVTK